MPRGDLSHPKAIYAKGILFLALAVASAALLLVENPTLKTACLLFITCWAWCRSYYFAFYVIEKYVDPEYRFAGLIDFARYLLGRPRR